MNPLAIMELGLGIGFAAFAILTGDAKKLIVTGFAFVFAILIIKEKP